MEMNPRALDVLGDPTRRAIVDRLRRGPSAVGRLAEGMPVSRPAISQHLTVLRTAGVVSEHREGTRRIYRLEPAGIEELRRWVEALAADARGGPAGVAVPVEPPAEPPAPELVTVRGRPAASKADRPASKGDGGRKRHGKKRAGKK